MPGDFSEEERGQKQSQKQKQTKKMPVTPKVSALSWALPFILGRKQLENVFVLFSQLYNPLFLVLPNTSSQVKREELS